jgi:hypothetical protein
MVGKTDRRVDARALNANCGLRTLTIVFGRVQSKYSAELSVTTFWTFLRELSPRRRTAVGNPASRWIQTAVLA